MKVALPVKMGLVDKYFERAKTFLILEIEGTAMKKSFFSVNPSQSNRKQVIELFQKSGVKLIIVDKIGTKAKQTLSENGFQVITRVRGPVTEIAQRIIQEKHLTLLKPS
ncbi:NifB/NifX family molybdenum-iron cluster-binding protein [Desulfofundulus thermocisternus]|jgi:predicted Fe-Mo cluster-binding NifX family protein|uniref:NifB/NifX family molybdenum-iron cluster-binding protein n=1 Tax=Desulfofundulus thermocisternus TaxID=42471 RepID=UPI000487FEC2|nr:NifB/NifX family molybdenum-iron cluster-binding protein [Desulfofundulus thermocisternus]